MQTRNATEQVGEQMKMNLLGEKNQANCHKKVILLIPKKNDEDNKREGKFNGLMLRFTV